jgi:hypothetical protein
MTYTDTIDGPLGSTTASPPGERLAGHHRDPESNRHEIYRAK